MLIQRGFRDKLEKHVDLASQIEIIIKVDGSSKYDVRCFGLGQDEKVLNDYFIVFSDNQKTPDGSIDYELNSGEVHFIIDMNALNEGVSKLAFTLSTEDVYGMSAVSLLSIKLCQYGNSIFELSLGRNDFSQEKSVVISEIYLKESWRFAAIASGYNYGIDELMASYGATQLSDYESRDDDDHRTGVENIPYANEPSDSFGASWEEDNLWDLPAPNSNQDIMESGTVTEETDNVLVQDTSSWEDDDLWDLSPIAETQQVVSQSDSHLEEDIQSEHLQGWEDDDLWNLEEPVQDEQVNSGDEIDDSNEIIDITTENNEIIDGSSIQEDGEWFDEASWDIEVSESNDESQDAMDAYVEKLEQLYPEHKVFALRLIDAALMDQLEAYVEDNEFESVEELLNSYGFFTVTKEEVKSIRSQVIYSPGSEPDFIKDKIETIMTMMESEYPTKCITASIQKTNRELARDIGGMYQWLGYANARLFLEAYGYIYNIPGVELSNQAHLSKEEENNDELQVQTQTASGTDVMENGNSDNQLSEVVSKLEALYPEKKIFALKYIAPELRDEIDQIYKLRGYSSALELLADYSFEVISSAQAKLIRNEVVYTPGNEPEVVINVVEEIKAGLSSMFPGGIITDQIQTSAPELAQKIAGMYQWLGYPSATDFMKAYGFSYPQVNTENIADLSSVENTSLGNNSQQINQGTKQIPHPRSTPLGNARKIPIADSKVNGRVQNFFNKLIKYYPEMKVFALDSIDSDLREKLNSLSKEIGYTTPEDMLNAYGFALISGDAVKQLRSNVVYTPGNEPDIVKNKVESIVRRLEQYYPNRVINGSIQNSHKNLSQDISGMYQWLGYKDNGEFLAAYGFSYVINNVGRPETAMDVIPELKKRYAVGPKPKSIGILMFENPDLKGQIKTLQNKANELFGMTLKVYFQQEGIIEVGSGASQSRGSSSRGGATQSEALEQLSDLYDELDPTVYGTYDDAVNKLDGLIVKISKKGQIYIFGTNKPITKLVVPYGIDRISDHAFANQTSLSTVRFSESVTEIGEGAFEGCSSLNQIELPDTIDIIGSKAFANCISLSTVRFGKDKVFYDIDIFAGSPCQRELLSVDEDSDSEDDFEYDINKSKGVIIKKYLGHSQVVRIPGRIAGSMVGGIDKAAFQDCQSVVEVYMPDTIKTLGNYAFKDCISLKKVKMSAGISNLMTGVFSGCIGLEEINIPDQIPEIKASTFNDAPLKKLFIGKGVSVVSPKAFGSDKRKIHVSVDRQNKHLVSDGSAIFQRGSKKLLLVMNAPKDYEIPDGTIEISQGAFKGMSNLENVVFPSSLRVIDEGAFRETGLRTAIFNEGLQKIGNSAFNYCQHLTSVVFPTTLESIGDRCFEGCSIISVKLPASLSYLGKYAFTYSGNDYYGASGVQKLEIDKKNTTYSSDGTGIYEATQIGKKLAYLIKRVNQYTVKPGTVEIGDYVFCHNWDFKRVSLPDGLVKIGSKAFEGCYNLTDVILPNSVEEIGDYAFSGTQLREIQLPSKLKRVGSGAFMTGDNWQDTRGTLRKISIGQGNTNFDVINDTLFEKMSDGKLALVLYCGGKKKYEVPQNVVKICEGAFYKTVVEEVHIPKSVTEIGEDAFSSCRKLKRLYVEFATPENGISQAVIYIPSDNTEAWGEYMDCIRVDRDGNVFDFVKYDGLFDSISSRKDKILVATDRLKSALKLVPLYEEKYLKYLRRNASEAVKIVVEFDDLAGLNILAELQIFTVKNIDQVIEVVNAAQKPELLSYLMNYKNSNIGMTQTNYDL